MPLRSFKCPDGEEIETAKCLAENGCRMCSRCCARPVLKLMAKSSREWKGIPSTTQLLKGTMQAFLEIVHPFALSPDKMAFTIHGSGTHYALEMQGDKTSQAELDYSDEEGSVRPDLLETENGKTTLIDYKIVGSFAVAKALGIYFEDVPVLDPITNKPVLYKSGAKKGKIKTKKERRIDPKLADLRDWALQLNNYRVGIEKQKKAKIDRIQVQALVRDGGTISALSRGIDKNVYLIDIPRLPDDEIKEFFKMKKDALLLAMKQGHWESPCNDLERWNDRKCTEFCPVNRVCPYWIDKYSKSVNSEIEPSNAEDEIGNDGCPKGEE